MSKVADITEPESEFTPESPVPGLDWDQFILLANGVRFVSRIFTVAGDKRDCLASLFKEHPGEPWTFAIRFRYYRSDFEARDPFNDHDERSGGAFVVPPEKKAEVIKLTREMLGYALAAGFGGDGVIHEIVIETNDMRAIKRALEREPFFHIKSAEELLRSRG